MSQITKITPTGELVPEKSHQNWYALNNANMFLGAIIQTAQNSQSRLLSGTLSGSTLKGVKVIFRLEDGTVEQITFPDKLIVQNGKRQVYFAKRSTGTIVNQNLSGQELDQSDFINLEPNEDLLQ